MKTFSIKNKLTFYSIAFCFGFFLIIPFSNGLSLNQTSDTKYKAFCPKWDYAIIHYNDIIEYHSACEGIKRTEEFFTSHFNYQLREPVKIIFAKEDNFTDKTIKQYLNTVLGLYVPIIALNPKHRNKNTISTIIIKPWKTINEDLKTNNYFFFKKFFSKSIYSSITTHELTHHFHQTHFKSLGLTEKPPSYREQEVLSAIVQIETIPIHEKKQILDFFKKKYPPSYQINIQYLDNSLYSLEPTAFIIMAYKAFIETPSIATDIFNGNTNWPEIEP